MFFNRLWLNLDISELSFSFEGEQLFFLSNLMTFATKGFLAVSLGEYLWKISLQENNVFFFCFLHFSLKTSGLIFTVPVGAKEWLWFHNDFFAK